MQIIKFDFPLLILEILHDFSVEVLGFTKTTKLQSTTPNFISVKDLKFMFWSKKDGKDQEMIQSSTTPDPGYHMGK